ncbi:MAG: hypothetical protein HWN69_04660 [Desulfobacterales bacterium]|nr:hypothetical protein [Desulfobacterales bacterium]
MVGGIKDLFEDGKMGFFTESKNLGVFAELLEKLIVDADLRYKIGRFNHEYTEEHFMASHIATRIESIYRKLLSDATDY